MTTILSQPLPVVQPDQLLRLSLHRLLAYFDPLVAYLFTYWREGYTF